MIWRDETATGCSTPVARAPGSKSRRAATAAVRRRGRAGDLRVCETCESAGSPRSRSRWWCRRRFRPHSTPGRSSPPPWTSCVGREQVIAQVRSAARQRGAVREADAAAGPDSGCSAAAGTPRPRCGRASSNSSAPSPSGPTATRDAAARLEVRARDDLFEVSEGAAATPDLGVLRVYTPVALCGNTNAARERVRGTQRPHRDRPLVDGPRTGLGRQLL